MASFCSIHLTVSSCAPCWISWRAGFFLALPARSRIERPCFSASPPVRLSMQPSSSIWNPASGSVTSYRSSPPSSVRQSVVVQAPRSRPRAPQSHCIEPCLAAKTNECRQSRVMSPSKCMRTPELAGIEPPVIENPMMRPPLSDSASASIRATSAAVATSHRDHRVIDGPGRCARSVCGIPLCAAGGTPRALRAPSRALD